MTRIPQTRRMLYALTSATALVLSTGVQAESKKDRAREAIAVAEAKIHAAEAVGASAATPNQLAHAGEILANAREELKSGFREQAIVDANHAAALADASSGETQRLKAASAINAVENAQADAAEAHQQAAEATAQAQAEAAEARQQAAEANARAANAEQAAQVAQNSAALAAAGASAGPPAAVSTTVTTEDHTTASTAHPRVTTKHVVRKRRAAPATHTQTTTTVVQTQ